MAKGSQESAKRSILFRSKKLKTKKENTRGLHGLVGVEVDRVGSRRDVNYAPSMNYNRRVLLCFW